MKHRPTFCALFATSVLLLAGCEQTATKAIHVQPPAGAPAPAAVDALQPLPANRPYLADLTPRARPAIDVLVENVQSDYDAGQREYKAGNLDNAQTDFDQAVDRILKSGFQADADPRLGKLFDQLSSVVDSDEIDAIEGNDEEEAEAPAEPAPIDEIADMTLPAGDPRLAAKAETELIRVHHDLPLTVNESVLQYLSFFTTPRGRAIVERGLDRAGRYSDMIRARARPRRRAAGPDLFGAGGERLSAATRFRGPAREGSGNSWLPRRGIRSRPELLGGRSQRSGKSHAGGCAPLARSLRRCSATGIW